MSRGPWFRRRIATFAPVVQVCGFFLPGCRCSVFFAVAVSGLWLFGCGLWFGFSVFLFPSLSFFQSFLFRVLLPVLCSFVCGLCVAAVCGRRAIFRRGAPIAPFLFRSSFAPSARVRDCQPWAGQDGHNHVVRPGSLPFSLFPFFPSSFEIVYGVLPRSRYGYGTVSDSYAQRYEE